MFYLILEHDVICEEPLATSYFEVIEKKSKWRYYKGESILEMNIFCVQNNLHRKWTSFIADLVNLCRFLSLSETLTEFIFVSLSQIPTHFLEV